MVNSAIRPRSAAGPTIPIQDGAPEEAAPAAEPAASAAAESDAEADAADEEPKTPSSVITVDASPATEESDEEAEAATDPGLRTPGKKIDLDLPPPPVIKPQWKVLEPEDQSDPVEHEVCEIADRNEQWKIMAASVRGKLHAHKALWREDAYAYGWVDDWTMIVVSDGAGSAKLSRIGARIACDESMKELENLLRGWTPAVDENGIPPEAELLRLRSFLIMAARNALDGVTREAQTRDISVRLMHATLLLMVHIPLGENDMVAAIQVGDGAIGIYSKDGSCTLLGVADHGEYSSETRFLTTPHIEREFEQRVLFSFKKDILCLAAMCDGVSDDFFPENKRLIELFEGDPIPGMETKDGEPVRGVMHQVVRDPQDGQALRDWLRYEKKASSDDRTLVLMYRS